MYKSVAAVAALIATVNAQGVGTNVAEQHPKLSWSKCSGTGGAQCSAVNGEVVIDANWRWLHSKTGTTNCYTGNKFDSSLCPNNQACTSNCVLEGAQYAETYGVQTSGNQLSIGFVTRSQGTNIGSRMYLMENESRYQMFTLLGNEFTFDVDVSQLGCGLNGALYFVSMDDDGGKAKYSTNTAGAKYGTGYCDAQCPRDLKFISGLANSEGWTPSTGDINAGVGGSGSCCSEMDIWEANSFATAFTPHPCTTVGQTRCNGANCGGTYAGDGNRYKGVCDPDGCDFNSYRQGVKNFYGPGGSFTVDTTKKVSVVTQFIKGSNGNLSEIKRFYVQNGKTIANSQSTIAGATGNSITDKFCAGQKAAFGDITDFQKKGGLAQMGKAVASPMVLVMSLWDDVSFLSPRIFPYESSLTFNLSSTTRTCSGSTPLSPSASLAPVSTVVAALQALVSPATLRTPPATPRSSSPTSSSDPSTPPSASKRLALHVRPRAAKRYPFHEELHSIPAAFQPTSFAETPWMMTMTKIVTLLSALMI